MSAPTAADWLAYAKLMNGTCQKCGRILPHPKSEKVHVCAAALAGKDSQHEQ